MADLGVALTATVRCSQAVIQATSVQPLLEQVCSTLVSAGYCFSWVGWVEHDAEKTVRPLAFAGHEDGYLSNVAFRWSDSELGRGPAGTAIRTAKPVVFQDLASSHDYNPWQTEAAKRGYRSSAALPLMSNGIPFALLSIYADRLGAFGQTELESLVNLADILSFGITQLREREAVAAERRRTEEALRHREERLRQAARVSRIGIFDHDHLTDAIYWSPEQREIYGIGPDEPITLPLYFKHVHPEDREAMMAAVQRAHDPLGDGLFDVEHRIVRQDGEVRWLTTRSQTFFRGEREARHKVRTIGAVLDVTQRRRVEEDYRKLAEVAQNSPDFIGIASPDGKVLFVNSCGQALVGLENDKQAASKTIFDYLPPEEIERFEREVVPTVLCGKSWLGEVLLKHFQTGQRVPFEMRAFPICDAQGEVIAIANVSRDIRLRKQFEEALRNAEEKYRGIFENAVLGIFQSTPEGRYLSVNPAMARMYGYSSPEEMISAVTDIERQEYVDPSRRRQFLHLLTEKGTIHDFEFEIYRKDFSRGWVSVNARVVYDTHAEPAYYEGTQEDITERKALEAQYRQAQKMEAVGRLAGGIAHDYNNILSVIIGYCDLMIDQVAPNQPVATNISRIKQAGRRAADLTRQLLAFSRQQVFHARVLDLNKIVYNVSEMLKRAVGEDITLSFRAGDGLGLVKADPGQIEQVIMNLAVNARDAMPRGGKVIIETKNTRLDDSDPRHGAVVPGPYVMLSFADTGCGIPPENLSRIFEPFFTTKPSSQGTGLGLATVYGIVRQSNGYIWVYSEPDKGSTFKLYFPRVEEEESVLRPESEEKITGGLETILLVEDERDLREVAANLLETVGYRVLKAAGGHEALAISQSAAGKISLVITDIVMPTMSGIELYSQLRELMPSIKVLYMSGYGGGQLSSYLQSAPETMLLEKPFTKSSLLKAVRTAMDSAQ